MQNLNSVRDKIDAALVLSKVNFNGKSHRALLNKLGLSELNDDDVTLYAWDLLPSAITACPTCIFKGPDAGKRTHSDCPPRPSPSPSPSPSQPPQKKN